MELKKIVESLLAEKKEGGYWDFKQEWHGNNADLLKDILCMANNTTDEMQDGYIIVGVEDKSFTIKGVPPTNRKNQENVTGFLSEISWSAEEMPVVEISTTSIDDCELDVIVVRNRDMTPYYILKDYEKADTNGKNGNKVIVRAGVIYSRIGDRNTSSAECAMKSSAEFLWKKRFGLVGSDEFKVVKRLQNTDSWYTLDEFKTIYNDEFNDIRIEKNEEHTLEVAPSDGLPTAKRVMDFPYLFCNMLSWEICQKEMWCSANWDVFLNNRKLKISLQGARGALQTHWHTEPKCAEFDYASELRTKQSGIAAHYYYYIDKSIGYLSHKLFYHLKHYRDFCERRDITFEVIPVFKTESEYAKFIDYINSRADEFKQAVIKQPINEKSPSYVQKANNVWIDKQSANTVEVYRLCKTMVQWLETWRKHEAESVPLHKNLLRQCARVNRGRCFKTSIPLKGVGAVGFTKAETVTSRSRIRTSKRCYWKWWTISFAIIRRLSRGKPLRGYSRRAILPNKPKRRSPPFSLRTFIRL
jgi:hypothetical protein